MKKISIIIISAVALLYSCAKDNAQDEQLQRASTTSNNFSGKGNTNTSSYLDSSCHVCTENKTVTLTPANFLGSALTPGIELKAARSMATISDPEIQPYARLTVTVKNSNGWLAALPLFYMANDGSYESLNYTYGSSVLLLHYVRFNKTTSTFTYKPVNNLVVNYSIVKVM